MRLIALTATAFLTSSCYFQNDYDYYAEIEDVCAYPTPRTDSIFDNETSVGFTTLTPECAERLTSALEDKISHPSLDHWSNPQLKLRLLETLQFIAGVPLKEPAANAILGFGTDLIPFDLHCRVRSGRLSGCPARLRSCSHLRIDDPKLLNCSLFNFLLNQVDRFTFNEGESGFDASFSLSGRTRAVELRKGFWDGTLPASIKSIGERASLLLHEAYHGLGEGHPVCSEERLRGLSESFDVNPRYQYCDYDLTSAHGIELYFLLMVLEGTWDKRVLPRDPSSPPLINSTELKWMLSSSCILTRHRFLRLPAGLRTWVDRHPECAPSPAMIADFMRGRTLSDDERLSSSAARHRPNACAAHPHD